MSFFIVLPAAATYFGAATLGASIAGAIGLTGLSAAATIAIGAGTISAGFTALRGGGAEDIFKSAILSGATSYIGGTIGKDIASNVRADAIMNGDLSFNAANAVGNVVSSTAVGAVNAGLSAAAGGKDPIEALLQGGLNAAMSSAVSQGVNLALADMPGFEPTKDVAQTALQRATKTALSTIILSGGNLDKVEGAVLNSFVQSAGNVIENALVDKSNDVRSANTAFKETEQAYTRNIESQNSLINQYNTAIQPLVDQKSQLDELVAKYDDFAYKYNNYDSYMQSKGYHYDITGYDHEGNYNYGWGKLEWQPERQIEAIDEYGFPYTYRAAANQAFIEAPKEESKGYFFENAKAIDSQATALANDLNAKAVNLLGGEVTKYRTETRTETQMQWVSGFNWEGYYETQIPVEVPVTVDVPYKEKVEGALTPVKQQIESLQARSEDLAKDYTAKKDALTTSIQQFQDAEVNNASVIGKTLNNYVSASDLYRNEFGSDPTEDQLKAFADTGDIIGTVSKLVADNNNEQAAQEAGFSNYADYTAAGNVAPNDYYARREGWDDYAQKLAAQGNNYSNPQQWKTYLNEQQTAVDNGFINYKDYQFAGGIPSNDFYAQKEGWSDFSEKQQAQDFGFKTPTAWSIYTTDLQTRQQLRLLVFLTTTLISSTVVILKRIKQQLHRQLLSQNPPLC